MKRERRMSAPSRETSKVFCVDIHQPKIITTTPGIQDKLGMTRNGRRSHFEDTSDEPKALKFQASLQPQSSSLRPKNHRHRYRQMVDEHALSEMISNKHKSWQEAATRRPKTAPSTTRNKKMPEREVIGLRRKPAIKIKSGVARSGRRSHIKDTNDQLQATRLPTSLQLQSLSPQPNGPKGTRYNYREMVKSNSLDERSLAWKIGCQRKCQQVTIRRPKSASSTTRNKKMPESEVTAFTRKPGIKVKRGVTKNGMRSHLKDSNDQLQPSRFVASL